MDRNVGIGVFPEPKKFFIGSARFGEVALFDVSASQAQPG